MEDVRTKTSKETNFFCIEKTVLESFGGSKFKDKNNNLGRGAQKIFVYNVIGRRIIFIILTIYRRPYTDATVY